MEHWGRTTRTFETGWANPDDGYVNADPVWSAQRQVPDHNLTILLVTSLELLSILVTTPNHGGLYLPLIASTCLTQSDIYLSDCVWSLPIQSGLGGLSPPLFNKQIITYEWHQISNMRVLIYHVEARAFALCFLNFPPPALEKCSDTLDLDV